MSEDLLVKKPPIQLLAETEDTVTMSRATFEGLLDELEDLEDSLAVARHRLELVDEPTRGRKCIICGRITDVFYAGHAGQCAVCDVKQQAQQRGIQITSAGDFTRHVQQLLEEWESSQKNTKGPAEVRG